MSPPRRSPATTAELRASLVAHAARLVAREGAAALTMRALAAEAGCAVGLPYKVFADRRELVAEVIHAEFAQLRSIVDELTARVGTATVAGNLAWFADRLLGSPAVALAQETFRDDLLMKTVTARIHSSGAGPASFEAIISGYLAAEKGAGRVDGSVDEQAFGFVLAGALHNLVVSGEGYPRPSKRRLRQVLEAVALRLAPPASRRSRRSEDPDGTD